jgi:hypothetical protein
MSSTIFPRGKVPGGYCLKRQQARRKRKRKRVAGKDHGLLPFDSQTSCRLYIHFNLLQDKPSGVGSLYAEQPGRLRDRKPCAPPAVFSIKIHTP